MNKNLKPNDFDADGFKACKKCENRNILTSGFDLDNIYIKCIDCGFCTETGYFYEVLKEWNEREEDKKESKI